MEFDQTQALPLWDDEDDHDVAENNEPKAFLEIPQQREVPDFLELPLHKGSNTIGRSETCKICIHSKVLSKEHAVIEIDNNSFLIYDRGSLNKTWKGKTLLKPNIRYNLESDEDLTFGNIKTKFIIKESDRKETEDSGSETGSESMLLLHEQCSSPPTVPCENVLDSDGKQTEVPADKKQCSLPPTLPYENVLDSDEEPNEFPADGKDHSIDNSTKKKREKLDAVEQEVELAATVPYECALESDEDATDSSVVIEETLPATVPYMNLPDSDNDTNELPTVEQNDAAVVAILTDLGNELSKKQSPSTENIKDTQLSYPPTQLYIGKEISAADMPTQKINIEDESDNSDWEKESNDDVSLLPPTQPYLTVANEEKSKTQEQRESKIIGPSSNVPEKSREEMLNTSTFNIPENATNSKENRDYKQFLDDKPHPSSTSKVEIIDDNQEPEVFDETFLNAETQPLIDEGKGDMDDIILLRADQNARLSYINKYMVGEDDSLPPTQLYIKPDSCMTKATSKCSEQSIATTKSHAAFEESSKNILSGINTTAADESVLNDDDIILCPSTQRRSDTRDAVKRGDECSSPVLRSEDDNEVEDSIAETPPHLLTESESTGSPSASKDNCVLKFIINMSNSMTENDTFNELNETVLNTDSDGTCKSGNDNHNKDKIPSTVSHALSKKADLQMINSTKVKTNSEQSHAFDVEEKGNKEHNEHHEANSARKEITPAIKNKKSLVNASKKRAPKGDIASGTVIDASSGKVNCDNLEKVIVSSKIASSRSDPKTKNQKRTSRRQHSEETIEEINKFIELSKTSIARNQTNENIENSIVQCTEESEILVNDMTHENIEGETKKGNVKRKSVKVVSGGKNEQQNESSSETKTISVDQPSINAFAQEPTRRSRRSRNVPLKFLENGTRSNSKVEAITSKQDQETMSKDHSTAKVTKGRKMRKSKCVEPNDNIVFHNLVGKTSEKGENSAVHSLEKNEILDDERKSIHDAERNLKANAKSELVVSNKLNEQVKKSNHNAKKILIDQTSKNIAQERPTRQSRRSHAVQSKLSEKETVSNDKIESVVGKQKQGTVLSGRKRTRQIAQQDKSELDETDHHVKIPDVSLEMQNQNDHDDSLSHERKSRANQKCKQEAKLIVEDLEKPVSLVGSIENNAKHFTRITRKNSQHSSNEHITSSEPIAKSRRKTDIPENQHLSPVIETNEENKNSKLLSIEKSPRSRGRPKRQRKSVTKQDFFYCKDQYNNEVSATVLNDSHGINTLPEIKMTFIKVPETKHSAIKEAKKGKGESISVIASAEIKTRGNSNTASALVTDSNVKDNFSRRKQQQKNEGQTLSNEFIDKHSSSTTNNDSSTAVNIDKKKVLLSDNPKMTRKTRSRIKKDVKYAVFSSDEDVSDITNTSFISSSSCKDSETVANNASINKSNKTNSRKSRAKQKQGVSPEIIASLPSPSILENTISEDAKSVDSTPSKASGRKRRQMTKHSVSSHNSSDVAVKDESTDEQSVLLSTNKSHSTSKFQADISSSSEKEAKLVESGRGHRKRGISKEENEDVIVSPQRRRLSRIIKPKVMFTGVGDEEEQKIVANLGGELVEDIGPCSHLVTDKLRRTVKALCCIAKGIPLVNVKWLQQCKKSNSFIDHTPFLIKDRNAEKQYGFQLKETLEKAAEQPLFTSWSIHVTPKVVPSPEQMKDIIHWAGGKHLAKMPSRLSTRTVIISCDSDLKLCTHAAKCGIPVVGAEFLLTGLLRYQIDVNSYKLNLK